jgi:hypothetical protein
MANFIKEFLLRQHTPLIHFQHDQDGATLRATELKPKIDAWIIRQKTGMHPRPQTSEGQDALMSRLKAEIPEWLVGGGRAQHAALDYKLHIRAEKKTSYLVASNISRPAKDDYDRLGISYLAKTPYFADNEPIKNRLLDNAKRGVMYDDIKIEVFCLDEDLLQEIERAIPYVFSYNNFGIRQSKGFGSFSPWGQTVESFEGMLREHETYKSSFVYRFEGNASLDRIFSKIDLEYKVLKSGFNDEPSQMKVYFQKKGIEWEKPAIKKDLVYNKGIPKMDDYTNDKNTQYIRALLGVAELYEFPHDREKIKVENADKEDSGFMVERFRSPITFKVFGSNVYMLPEVIDDKIYDKVFTFTNTRRASIKIKTPPKGVFNLVEFLENHVENSWENV